MALLLVLPNIYGWLEGEKRGLWVGGVGKLFLIYLGIALFSTLWSVGRIATLGKVFELFVALFVVFAVAAQPDAEKRLKRLFFLTLSFAAVILFVNLVGYFVAPEQFRGYLRVSDSYRMTAGFTALASNAMSRLGAIIALSALAFAIEREPGLLERLLALLLVGFGFLFPILTEGAYGCGLSRAGGAHRGAGKAPPAQPPLFAPRRLRGGKLRRHVLGVFSARGRRLSCS